MKQRIKSSLILLAIGIAINVALAIIKMYVGLSSNSLTIMLDATNSFFDVITGIITVVAFAVLFIPRSKKAPFGYGRSEYLAGFIVAVVSAVVGGMFFIQSLNRLAMPEPIWFGWQNCVLISIAVPIKLVLGIFYYIRNKKLKSKAIAAIVLDCFLDTGITSASLVSFAISSNVDYAVDAIFGMVISILVLVFAIKMIIDNVKSVVQGDGCAEEGEALIEVCNADNRIKRIGEISLHDYGHGAKAGTAQVVFADGVDLEEIKRAETEIHEKLIEMCGLDLWLVPLSDEDCKSDDDCQANEDGKANEARNSESGSEIGEDSKHDE